ncbi:hypothetical protein CFAM422_005537 [Trichoderma lentiforme]|uniref:Uncharacterized protein n=1 Tax=Trichoderma lentiforme TaxID=1567552 RepID=A0A9P5CCV1_9HYPO|nr:hypothetical protein CFAM422_005537 [Trichoderma lentiforme]
MGLRPRTGRRVAQWDAHSARILSRRVTRRGHYTNRPAAPRLQRPPARSAEVDAACTSGAEVSCSTLWIGLHASQQAERPAYSVLWSVFDAVSTLHQLGSNGGVRPPHAASAALVQWRAGTTPIRHLYHGPAALCAHTRDVQPRGCELASSCSYWACTPTDIGTWTGSADRLIAAGLVVVLSQCNSTAVGAWRTRALALASQSAHSPRSVSVLGRANTC